MLAAYLNTKTGLRCLHEGRRAPLTRVRISHHRHPAASLVGENKTGLRAIEENDPLCIAQVLCRNAFVRFQLHLLQQDIQFPNAGVQPQSIQREGWQRQSEKYQADSDRFHPETMPPDCSLRNM